jgi:hypothetical protein
MSVIYIREVGDELMRQIRMEAASAGVTVPTWALHQLGIACGMVKPVRSDARTKAARARRPRVDAQHRAPATPTPIEATATKELTASGLPRCQSHDDTGWQCRLADGHGNNCM